MGSDVTIYIKRTCSYCQRAMQLLDRKKISYNVIDVGQSAELYQKMVDITGQRTVPQIFIKEQHIGGCDDLHRLESEGKLDQILAN